jgi:hypothetical protein
VADAAVELVVDVTGGAEAEVVVDAVVKVAACMGIESNDKQ